MTQMDLYTKNKKIFIETHFPLSFNKPIVYLMLEAFYYYLLNNSSFDFANWFLPMFLIQCAAYNGQRPSLAQLGRAPQMAFDDHTDFLKQSNDQELFNSFCKQLDD